MLCLSPNIVMWLSIVLYKCVIIVSCQVIATSCWLIIFSCLLMVSHSYHTSRTSFTTSIDRFLIVGVGSEVVASFDDWARAVGDSPITNGGAVSIDRPRSSGWNAYWRVLRAPRHPLIWLGQCQTSWWCAWWDPRKVALQTWRLAVVSTSDLRHEKRSRWDATPVMYIER